MKILMNGSTGFVGRNLMDFFLDEGIDVTPLTRSDYSLDDQAFLDKCKGTDVAINLAGAPIAARWTEEYKKVLYSSRIDVTKKTVQALRSLEKKPSLFISTSAAGIYSAKGIHTEESFTYSDGFLGRLARSWEQEALRAEEYGIRTVIFRFGIVLGKEGGALSKMILPFRMGLGGTVGDGKQPFSWVHIEDLKRAYMTAIKDRSFSGIYNLVSPEPTTNEGLTKALGDQLGRPTFLRVPSFLLQLKYGQGAQVLLDGQHVLPKRLLDAGFSFSFPEIRGALKNLLEEDER